MNNAISVRFEKNQRTELEFYARQNFHKPSSFLRIVTQRMLDLCRKNEGQLPTETQLQLVMPVVVQKRQKK